MILSVTFITLAIRIGIFQCDERHLSAFRISTGCSIVTKQISIHVVPIALNLSATVRELLLQVSNSYHYRWHSNAFITLS